MQKVINVVDYLQEMAMTLTTIYKGDISGDAIEASAVIFFNIFGKETAETLVSVHEDKQEGSEEVYKSLFVLYKEMKHDDAEYFIKMLEQGIAETKEEVS